MLCLFVSEGHRNVVAFHLGNRRFIPRIKPSVRFRDLFDAQGDGVAQVGFGADVGEVVRHGVKIEQSIFPVHNFLHFSSTFFQPGHPHLGMLPAAPSNPHANPPFFKKFCP